MNRCLAITLAVLPLLFPSAFSTKQPEYEKVDVATTGVVVLEAKSARPSGALKLTGYRVEEVQFPASQTVSIARSTNDGRQSLASHRAWWSISRPRNACRDLD